MKRSWYSASFEEFQYTPDHQIIGKLAMNSTFADLPTQKIAWRKEIGILRESLQTSTAIYTSNSTSLVWVGGSMLYCSLTASSLQ